MAEIVKGLDVAQSIYDELRNDLLTIRGRKPCLALLRVGEKAGDLSYEKGIRKAAEGISVEVRVEVLPENVTQAKLEEKLINLNEAASVDGILVFRPLPEHLSAERVSILIAPEKDVDCMSPTNMAKLAMGEKQGFFPCTPEAVVDTLDYMGVECRGKNVVIIGHSLVVGRPLGYMLIARDATVSWCHIFTKDVLHYCEDADIIISAAGKAGLVTEEHLRKAAKGCIVIDVGINKRADGKPGICGDVDFDAVLPYVGRITPVPGGIGTVTTAVLMKHVVQAAVLKLS